MIPALLLASMLALVSDGTPAPSLTPAPSAASPQAAISLPEIGRVKAVVLPCAVMHDLVIPSFAAARRADAHFAAAGSKLPEYARVVDDEDARYGVQREMLLSRIDSNLSLMLQDAQTLSKALGDPRFAKTTDPQVRAEHDQLEALYEAQMARASRLSEFVQRQSLAIGKRDLADNGAFGGGSGPATPTPTPTPIPGASTPPFGQPVMRGIAIGDAQSMREWTGSIDASMRIVENRAAKTFIGIANACR